MKMVLGFRIYGIVHFGRIGDRDSLGSPNLRTFSLAGEGEMRGVMTMVWGFHSDDIGYFEQIGDLDS